MTPRPSPLAVLRDTLDSLYHYTLPATDKGRSEMYAEGREALAAVERLVEAARRAWDADQRQDIRDLARAFDDIEEALAPFKEEES